MGDDAARRRVTAFERTATGYRCVLADQLRSALISVLGELRDELEKAKTMPHDQLPAHLRRLFPAGYHADAEQNAEYRRLTHDELVATHQRSVIESIELLERSTELSADDLDRFVRAVNATRLVVGTILDVSEDESDPAADDPMVDLWEIYDFLGWVLYQGLAALSGDAPE
ncbi:MAG: DUF2017 family protein [Actinobacteria bacterium]|nr:DUF2017 family protein [Actinomycetota bacterium]